MQRLDTSSETTASETTAVPPSPQLAAQVGAGHVGVALPASQARDQVMSEEKPTYRIEMKNIGIPPNVTFGWNIYRNRDVLPILRSEQRFVTRMAGLADANRSRIRLIDTKASG
jgi:hypothetical protein